MEEEKKTVGELLREVDGENERRELYGGIQIPDGTKIRDIGAEGTESACFILGIGDSGVVIRLNRIPECIRHLTVKELDEVYSWARSLRRCKMDEYRVIEEDGRVSLKKTKRIKR